MILCDWHQESCLVRIIVRLLCLRHEDHPWQCLFGLDVLGFGDCVWCTEMYYQYQYDKYIPWDIGSPGYPKHFEGFEDSIDSCQHATERD